MLQGESRLRLLQGVAIGSVATMIIGFNWGGWMRSSTADKIASEQSRAAVVAVLAPICVDKFQRSAGAPLALVELKKMASYEQGSFVEKGGWATPPGGDTADSAVAQACATMLGAVK
jgi:hypothetical protein